MSGFNDLQAQKLKEISGSGRPDPARLKVQSLAQSVEVAGDKVEVGSGQGQS